VVQVRDSDITGIELVPPPTQMVSGRIVAQNGGPTPSALLGFWTTQSYVGGSINADGTFNTRLHAGQHNVDLAGMPVGYSVASIRIGNAEAKGVNVEKADVSGIVITVAGPNPPASIRGRITGLPSASLSSATVELSGPIVGTVSTSVRPDGSFEFPTLVAGLYTVRISQVAAFSPRTIAVVARGVTEVTLTAQAK
jgi:hypothetical protein